MRNTRLSALTTVGPSSPTVPELEDPPEFRVDVAPERDVVRVCPVGELDLGTVGLVEAAIEELTAAGFTRLVLDLRGATFLDSTGIRLVLEAQRSSTRDGWSFAIIPGSDDVQRPLEVAGVASRLPFVDPRGYSTGAA